MSLRNMGPIVGAVGILVAAVWGYFVAQWYGLAGILLALLVSAISIFSLAMLVRSFGQGAHDNRSGTRATVLLFVFKLPLLMVFVALAVKLPATGLYCFLATLGLVYSACIWFLATNVKT